MVDLRLTLDDRVERLQRAWRRDMDGRRTLNGHLVDRLRRCHPAMNIGTLRQKVVQLEKEISQQMVHHISVMRHRLERWAGKLDALNPLAVLSRGYSIAYRLRDGRIIRRSSEVEPGEKVHVRLGEGTMECRVTDRR